jgi:hypothetical protein
MGIHRAGSCFELTGKAVMHAAKTRLFGIAQVQVGKEFPDGNGCVPYPRLFNFAQPPHALRKPAPWQPVGEKKVQVFVRQDALYVLTNAHGVNSSRVLLEMDVENE